MFALSLVQDKRINSFVLVGALGILYEAVQYFGYINGTADYLDVVCYILGACTIFLIKKRKEDI